MIAIPLGKVAVATPGTPVNIATLAAFTGAASQLPPSGQVHKIEVWPDPADTGVVFVEFGGTKVAALKSSVSLRPFCAKGESGLQPSAVSIDAAVAGNGPFVTLWVL